MSEDNNKEVSTAVQTWEDKAAEMEAAVAAASGDIDETRSLCTKWRRSAIEYPGSVKALMMPHPWPRTLGEGESGQDGSGGGDERWKKAWTIFGSMCGVLADDKLAALATAVGDDSAKDNWEVLFALGYKLIDVGLHRAAATALLRALTVSRAVLDSAAYLALSHGDPGFDPGKKSTRTLTELCMALEASMLNYEALKFLAEYNELVKKDYMLRYLSCFNALMVGDREIPQQHLPVLLERQNENLQEAELRTTLVETIQTMLARCSKLEELGPQYLTLKDLRGWHFVLHGSVLLHYSPYGRDAGMNGRYAFVQDSEQRCKEGIMKVDAMAKALDITFTRVFYLEGRDNEILARAAGEVMGLPADSVSKYPDEGTDEPGLIVVYDLTAYRGQVLRHIIRHKPGQILWSHAMNWLDEEIFMADVVTFFYQHNISPWGERLQISPDGSGVGHAEASADNVDEIARNIVEAQPGFDTPSEESGGDLEGVNVDDTAELVAMVRHVAAMSKEQGLAVLKTEGRRARTRKGGPVHSNYFL